LERETELHHSHLSARLKERRKHRANAHKRNAPAHVNPSIQAIITKLDTSMSLEEQAAALVSSLQALAGNKTTDETRK